MPYGQDAPGGYGQDQELTGDPSQWGPVMEGVNAAMFGMGPAVNEWLGNHFPGAQPTSADQQKANASAWEKAHPYQSAAANVVGGSLPYMAAGEVAAPLGLAGRMSAMAGTGGVGNSLLPMSEGRDASAEAVGGALAGAGGELGASALAGAGGKLAEAFLNRGVKVPSSAALKAIADPQYEALTNNPAIIPLDKTGPFVDDVLNEFNTRLLDETSSNRQFNKIASSSAPADAIGIPVGKFEQVRQNLNNILRTAPGTPDASAASLGKQRIDNFLQDQASNDPAVQQFIDDAQKARGNWRAYRTSDLVERNIERATGQSQTNLADNANQLISKRANAILQQPKLANGMSPDELSALKSLRSGSPVRNLAQSFGAATGHTGIGLAVAIPELAMQFVEHGFDPQIVGPTAAAMGGGMLAHKLANVLATRQGQGVASLIRQNSPAFRDMVASGASAAPVSIGPTQEAARKLMSALGTQQLNGMSNAP